MQELRKITDLGVAYVELCYEMVIRNMPAEYRYTHGQLAEFIRFFGVDRVILSTDYGQAHNPVPVEGMKTTIRMLIEQGFDDDQIRDMTARNPEKLLTRL
jgi:microsomal dipeptidase-like Zn-dependent dipeptidase